MAPGQPRVRGSDLRTGSLALNDPLGAGRGAPGSETDADGCSLAVQKS